MLWINFRNYGFECISECIETHIPIADTIKFDTSVNLNRGWGRCTYKKLTNEYTIVLNARLKENAPVRAIKETLLHELCHTVPNGMSHTGNWKTCVTILNNKYGYNIKRLSSDADKGITLNTDNFKYVCKCQNCGQLVGYKQMGKLIKNPYDYKCGICGGKWIRIK